MHIVAYDGEISTLDLEAREIDVKYLGSILWMPPSRR